MAWNEAGWRRIAILHFTAQPAIGGIENLIESQRRMLADGGNPVRLIVGEGGDPRQGEVVRLPELHPAHPAIALACADLAGIIPPSDHPLVDALYRRLDLALEGCRQCWVHNAFTVYLNPFLTVALARLARTRDDIRWVAWCSDLSEVSAYRPGLSPEERERVSVPHPRLTYVTISRARRAQIARLLALPERAIRVIPPPLDALAWLGINQEARAIAERLPLECADPTVLVPAKLLPHKNLDLAVRVAAQLRGMAPRPLILITGADSPHEREASDATRRSLRRLSEKLGAGEVMHLLSEVLGRAPERQTVRDLMLLSDLVFVPSVEEGFGIPLQEAAALRAPVLCSDIPPFREVAGGAARYFSLADAPESIARQVLEIAASPENRSRRDAIQSSLSFRRQLEVLLDPAGQGNRLPLP